MHEYLIHSGIRGQKWGVRRFQNKDGTWTAEGKKRRAVKEGYSDKPDKKSKDETKKEKIEISMKERISDISNVSAYQKAGEAYFNSLASENASSDEKAYYKWLGENSMTSRHY